MATFDKCFLFLDNPRGGVEDIAYLAGLGWVRGVFCNVHTYGPEQWATVRERCAVNNLFCGPWGRTAKGDPNNPEFDPLIVERVLLTQDRWNEPGIINPEKEIDGHQEHLDFIVNSIGARDTALSVQPTPFANLNWSVVGKIPILPQDMPVDQGGINWDTEALKQKWWNHGVQCVYITFGVYGGMKPEQFVLNAPYSLFTGDPIMATYTVDKWKPTSFNWKGCKEVIVPPTPKPLYDQPCKVGPRAAHDSGPRRAADIDLIVIHTAEAADLVGPDNTAQGVANFFAQESTQASTQLAVDRDNCVRMLPDLVIPWGASGANHDGLHVEICGRAGWDRTRWLSSEVKPMLDRTAAKVAKWCWQYKVPRRWLTIEELKADKRGLTTHVDVNKAFKKGSHWDPGPDFPRTWFLNRVKFWYTAIRADRTAP